ncbi:histone deacetylase family protein [Desulfurobacterium atlanticum]|uniref:Acetoin utilization deacetylase AcuC n=1 Tax=Desulfurobacterium atlanticum TaxID=240169 RepID=A0A238Z4F2_9BACT|nr:histone deacetylase [Desulfurobacterium atlanticum]SNR77791.1 Acetoin utilization deacetylase AcuC [Desulfurobacterium atlanticum]
MATVLYSDIFLKHNLPSHPENAERLKSFMKTVSQFPLKVLESEPVNMKLLEKIHDKRYISKVKSASMAGFDYLDPDTYVNEYSFKAAVFAAGACEKGVELIKEGEKSVLCAARPPGHHAEFNRAMGFCLFNNIVVAAIKALKIGFKKIFIVDFDAHHGNGTQHLIENYPQIFYFSTHQFPFYPGTGSIKENNFHIHNIPLPSGSGDETFIPIYTETLPEIVHSFSPEILLISAGFDFHTLDPLTGLNVSDKGTEIVIKSVFKIAKTENIPILLTLEGGYNLRVLEKAGEILFGELSSFQEDMLQQKQ